jgi:hypothetical protein
MKSIVVAMAAVALLICFAGPARAADQQTFWTISTGPVPEPYPTPTYYPVDWYGTLYYPIFWPLCVPPAIHHCRPQHAHIWPPHVPAGHVPVPRPPR